MAKRITRLQFVTITTLLIVAALYWCWSLITRPDFLPIKIVKIQGTFQHVTKRELKQSIDPLVQNGFFAVPIRRIRQTLLQIPWVAEVSVSRQWPKTVVITVEEQIAVARWQRAGFINANGEAFFPKSFYASSQLPVLQGPSDKRKFIFDMYQQIRAILARRGLHIASLSLNERMAWQLSLKNGMHIIIGRKNPINRMTRFVTVYNKVFASHGADVLSVDLRYSNGMAVRWKEQIG